MNRKEIIKYCLELPNTYEDYPFPDDNYSVTLKHKNNNKWFALIMNVRGEEYLNIKTNPELKHEVDIAIKRLKDYGFDVRIMPNAMASAEYLEEYPEARAQDLKDAFKDDSIKGIFTALGGRDTLWRMY